MLFQSSIEPKYYQSLLYLLGAVALFSLVGIIIVIVSRMKQDNIVLTFLILGLCYAILRLFMIYRKSYGMKKVRTLRIEKDFIQLRYFHKNLRFGEVNILRDELKLFYEIIWDEGERYCLKFQDSQGESYQLDNEFGLWKNTEVPEIFNALHKMHYSPKKILKDSFTWA